MAEDQDAPEEVDGEHETAEELDGENETAEEVDHENVDEHDSGHEDHGHDDHGDHGHDDHGGHGHGADRQEYDPENVALPERSPPLRSTAPQSDFTMSQVATGAVVMVVGVLIAFGLPLALI
jgi:hypothetical protein